MTPPPPRVALIPGGTRGIGRGIALDLVSRGWRVAVAYRSSAADARTLEEECHGASGELWSNQADVSDSAACESLTAVVLERWQRIDALIMCAGPYHRVSLLEETDEGWRAMFAHNLDPLFYLARAVSPGMIERGWGRIVSFAIARAELLIAQPDLTAHAIAKTGVIVLTRTLARMLAPHGITANTIAPGFIDSGNPLPAALEPVAARIPAGYIGEVSDVVSATRYLLTEDARYVNGSVIQVGGGWGL